MKSLVASCLVWIAAGTLASGAQAAVSSASADLQQLKLELIDLDPADGIAPWIDFVDEEIYSSVGGLAPAPWADSYHFGDLAIAGPTGSTSTSNSPAAMRSAAQLDSKDLWWQSYSAHTRQLRHFVLSPSTALRLSAVGVIQAAGSINTYEFSTIDMWLRFGEPGGIVLAEDEARFSYANDGNGSFAMSVFLASGQLAQPGVFRMQTGATTTFTREVPEPSSWAMLLAGSAVIGALSARARRPQ